MEHRETHSILVVEDDLVTRYAMARALRASGYKTMEAASGAEALEFAHYVSAVVLDIHLPDILGFEVCRLLRANAATGRLPIIHVTARFSSAEDKAQSARCGADAYFVSPIAPEQVVATLDELIARRAAAA